VDLTRALDLYCERTDASLLSEPLNAASNIGFFIAGWLIWRRAQTWDERLLALIAALVGVCSLAFHLSAQVWAAWADGLVILAFIYAYLWRYMARIARARWFGICAAIIAYAAVDYLSGQLFTPATLNGSVRYLPTAAALALMSAYAASREPAAGSVLGLATLVFAVSLTARTVDLAVCDALPIGTHFLWHLGNAWVLYLVARALTAGKRTVT
jgi:hypothetical protein